MRFNDVQESSSLLRAGKWLLESGIQGLDGGVARYRQTDTQVNLPVSTEITGYAISGFCFLFEETGDERFLAAARLSANFLIDRAWDHELKAMPFEVGERARYSYFFDCGMIARGMLWLYRTTRAEQYLEMARAIGEAMARDFSALAGFHPIVLLPCKSPADYEAWWSKMPGAFQLKAALAWFDLSLETGETKFRGLYDEVLAFSLRHYRETIDKELDELKKMDRLHAWSYFLEGLQPVVERAEIQKLQREALEEGEVLREVLAPRFLRSDVCAQLLRVRLLSGGRAAPGEIERIKSFQYRSEDRALDGGFAFATRAGVLMPHVNPVSTVFAVQAISFAESGLDHADWRRLI